MSIHVCAHCRQTIHTHRDHTAWCPIGALERSPLPPNPEPADRHADVRTRPPLVMVAVPGTGILWPGARIGDGTISVGYASEQTDPEQRTVYAYRIDPRAGADPYTAADLRSGACEHGSLQAALAALLSFLDAAGEGYAYTLATGRPSDTADLFPPRIAEWSYVYADEIALLRHELSEAPYPLIVEP